MGKVVGWKERKGMVTLIALQSILCQLRVIGNFHTADVRAISDWNLRQQQETTPQGLAISVLNPQVFQFNLSSIWAEEWIWILIIKLDLISFRKFQTQSVFKKPTKQLLLLYFQQCRDSYTYPCVHRYLDSPVITNKLHGGNIIATVWPSGCLKSITI